MLTRTATTDDIPALRALAQTIWRECYPGIITPAQIEFMLASMYSEKQIHAEVEGGVCWELAMEDGAPIGFLSYEKQPDSRVKLHKLYLLPSWQGRGFARQLLDHVLAQAKALRTTEVWLQVNKGNARAIAAYLKAGFHIASERKFDIGGGFVMDDFLMAKAFQ